MVSNMNNNVNSKPATAPTPAVESNKPANQQAQTTARGQTASAPATAAPPRQDAVSLTPQAQQMSQLTRKAGSESGVNQEKVDKIKQALADGSYKVDVERLAARMAQFESDLFGN